MFKVGDALVYRRDVCKVMAIKAKAFHDKDYYVLNPIYDQSLQLQVPIDNPDIRGIITKKNAEEIIKLIPEIKPLESLDVKFKAVESKYRDLLNSGTYEDLIIIIKTAYLKNQEKIGNKKPVGNVDSNFSELAEKYLYNEFSVALGMSYQAIKKHIMKIIISDESR